MSSDGEDGHRRPQEHHYMESLHHDKGSEHHAYYNYPGQQPHYSQDDHQSMGPPPPEYNMMQPRSREHPSSRPEHHHSMGPPHHRDHLQSTTSPLSLADENSPQHNDMEPEGPMGSYPPPYNYGPPGGPPPPYGYYGGGYYPPPPQYAGYPPYSGYAYPPPVVYPTQQPLPRQSQKWQSPPKRQPLSDHDSLKSLIPLNPCMEQDLELERTRSQAEIQVNPIRTSFHFFVDDVGASVQKEAEQECGAHDDLFLVYSNMNARLIQKWEELPSSSHAAYMAKEEEDRIRFQNDDEIASRHCATLTARSKSPRDDEDDNFEFAKKRASPSEDLESPPKRNKPDEESLSFEEEVQV